MFSRRVQASLVSAALLIGLMGLIVHLLSVSVPDSRSAKGGNPPRDIAVPSPAQRPNETQTQALPLNDQPLRISPSALAPHSGLTFDRVDDLYILATKAVYGTETPQVLNGWFAATGCLSVAPTRPHLESMAAGLGLGGSPVGAGQRDAARTVLKRCRGFFDNDPSANTALRKSLRERLTSFPDSFVGGLNQGLPTEAQLRNVLLAGDWQTFSLLAVDLLPPVEARLGIARNSKDSALLTAAWISANCYLGKDCSQSGVISAIHCVQSGQCDGQEDANWLAGLSQEDRSKFVIYRDWIVSKFKAGTAKAFLQ